MGQACRQNVRQSTSAVTVTAVPACSVTVTRTLPSIAGSMRTLSRIVLITPSIPGSSADTLFLTGRGIVFQRCPASAGLAGELAAVGLRLCEPCALVRRHPEPPDKTGDGLGDVFQFRPRQGIIEQVDLAAAPQAVLEQLVHVVVTPGVRVGPEPDRIEDSHIPVVNR